MAPRLLSEEAVSELASEEVGLSGFFRRFCSRTPSGSDMPWETPFGGSGGGKLATSFSEGGGTGEETFFSPFGVETNTLGSSEPDLVGVAGASLSVLLLAGTADSEEGLFGVAVASGAGRLSEVDF